MTKIRIIHWDDDEDAGTNIRVILNRAFGRDEIDYMFDSSPIKDFEKTLIIDEKPFDLLILDLLDKKNHLVATTILKQLPKESKVIILTRNADEHVENEINSPVIEVPFTKLYKSNTYSYPYKYFIPEIERITTLKRVPKNSLKLIRDENDLNANYQVSLVTEEHLINLISEYFSNKNYSDQITSVRISPIASGYSGALVFKVEYTVKSNTYILLKVDKIKSNLEVELKSAVGPNYEQIDGDYKLVYDNKLLKSEKDASSWYALTTNFLAAGETLKQKILNVEKDKTVLPGKSNEQIISEKAAEIDALIVTLFKKCLTDVYSKTIKKFDQQTIINPVKDLMHVIDDKRKAFILNIVKELNILSNEIEESKVNAIFSFPDDKKALDSEGNEKYNKIVLIHGDLHGNNVMVSKNGQIKIIDPANMGDGYWTRDICMLIVDLFAYGIDYNDKQHFGIERIEAWRNMGKCFFDGVVLENGNNNKVVCQALSNLVNYQYIKDNLGFNPWYELWEFQLSLVIEFLRISYKSNQLPAGKRAACMLIAIDGFEKAKKSYETFVKRQNK